MNLRNIRAFESNSKTYSFPDTSQFYGIIDFYNTLRCGVLTFGHNYIVEESTLWHDNYNQEVFVGDIISFFPQIGNNAFTGQVIYLNANGGYFVNTVKNNLFSLDSMRHYTDVKVLGNINQQPELLKNGI